MGHDNCAVKEWLLRVGTGRRKLILQKLKIELEERGLTQQEVYKGMLQLVTRPRVLLARSNIAKSPRFRTHVKEDSSKCKEPTPKKTIQEGMADISSEKLSSGKPDETMKKLESTPPTIRSENPDISSTPPSTTIPELLDEDVGGVRIAPFLGKKSRPTITLHLSSHGATNSKKDDQKIRPVPEIRIADSSVPDDESSVKDSAEKCTSKRHHPTDASAAKRPRIIEDLTCVEGTIFGKLALSKNLQPSAELSPAKKPKLEEISEDEQSCDATKNTLDKKTDAITAETTKKLRVRRKFRQLFGKTLTLSEIEEENEMMKETLPRKRRKESRLSLDSGVSLNELNFERTSASPDAELREMRAHTIERQFPAEQDELMSIKSEEKDSDDDPFARSMPLLDSLPLKNISNETEDAISTTQPDSSTTFEEKSEANLGGKFKILITPIDTVGVNSFAPMSLEIDIAGGSLVSTTSSTTESSIAAKSSIDENVGHEDLSKLLQMDVKQDCHITQQGNTISIQEQVDARIIPSRITAEEDVEIESRVAVIAAISAEGNAFTSQTKCGPDSGKIIADHQDLTLQSGDLDNKTISFATELCFNDKSMDSKDSQHHWSSLASEMRNSDQRTVNISSATCNYDFKSEANDSCQRNLISSATDDADSQKLPTSVDFAPELGEIAIKKELTDVGETQDALKDVEESQKALTDVEKIKKELSDSDETIKKEVPNEENSTSDAERENKESTEIEEPQVASPAALAATEKDKNPQNSVPHIRVLHHSELGSRWCPTPINGNNSIPSIPEAQKIPQYQSPPVKTTTQIQGAVNNKLPYPANEIHYLHFLILNAIPAATSNDPNPYSKDGNSNNFPQAQPVGNCVVQQGTTSSTKASPSPATVNGQSNAPTTNSTQFNIQIVRQVLERLTILDWCMESCYYGPTVNDRAQIRILFCEQKYWLNRELRVVYGILGTDNWGVVVPWLVKNYPNFVPPEKRCLNFEKILNILVQTDLPMPRYAAQTQMQGVPAATAAQTQMRGVAAATAAQIQMQGVPAATAAQIQIRGVPAATAAQTQMQGVPAATAAAHRHPTTTATSRRPENPPNPRNSAANIAQNVQPCASASQPEFTRPQPRPRATAAVQKGYKFTKAQLKQLNDQIATCNEIYKIWNRQLTAMYLRQVAAHKASLRPATREMSLQEKMKRIAQRATDQWLMSMAAAPVEENSANKQTELRQSPGTLSQQQNQGTLAQRRVYPISTFVPPPVNVRGTDARYQGTIPHSQPTVPVSVQNLNTQQQQSPLSTGNFVSQDPKFTARDTNLPVPVEDIYFQQQMRRLMATANQRLPSQSSTNGSRRSPVEMENIGARIDQRRSPLSSSQQNSSTTCGPSMVRINLPNTAATLDNGLRKSPATSSDNSARNFTVPAAANGCATCTSIPTQVDNTVAHIQPQRSLAASTVQQIQPQRSLAATTVQQIQPQRSLAATTVQQIQPQCSFAATTVQQIQPQCSLPATSVQQIQQSSQGNVPVPVDDNIGASLPQQCSSAAPIDYEITLEELIRYNLGNTVSADEIYNQLEARLTTAAFSADTTEKSAAQAAENCSSTWTSIPTQIDNTDAPIQQQCSPVAMAVQQIKPEEPFGGNQRVDDDDDDSGDQFELRLSPASTIEDTTTTDSVQCSDSTSIPQESPAANQSSPIEELNLCINQANFSSTNDNVGAQLEPQSDPAAVQQITADHQESAFLHSRRNVQTSVICSNPQVDLPRRSPIATAHQTPVERPVLFDSSSATATDKDCSVELAREQQEERQSPVAPISGKTASGSSKISNESTGNECNVKVVDVLEALDALSSITRGKRSNSSRPAEEPETKSSSVDAGSTPEDPIATIDADETNVQEKHREENNNCESFQSKIESTVLCEDPTSVSAEVESTGGQDTSNNESTVLCRDPTSISAEVKSTDGQEASNNESTVLCGDPSSISAEVKSSGGQDTSNNESTILCGDSTSISLQTDSTEVQEIEADLTAVSVASLVPVITLDDDDDEEDDEEDLELFILEDCESPKESKDADSEAENECKQEMLPESAEAAREAEKEEMVSSWEIDNETSEIFSILDVKSIPKDVFYNMGNSDQVEGPPTPGIEETMLIDSVDIKDEALNCSRCGKISSVACAQCRSASYCSAECHQIHWTEIHYLSCKPVPEEVPAHM